MVRVLVADDAEGTKLASEALRESYCLVPARTLKEAIQLLESEPFDAVICGAHFDDSRMLDLLRAVKADERWRLIPFICFQHKTSNLLTSIEKTLEFSARSLGACDYLSFSQYERASNPAAELRKAIERCLRKEPGPGETNCEQK